MSIYMLRNNVHAYAVELRSRLHENVVKLSARGPRRNQRLNSHQLLSFLCFNFLFFSSSFRPTCRVHTTRTKREKEKNREFGEQALTHMSRHMYLTFMSRLRQLVSFSSPHLSLRSQALGTTLHDHFISLFRKIVTQRNDFCKDGFNFVS